MDIHCLCSETKDFKFLILLLSYWFDRGLGVFGIEEYAKHRFKKAMFVFCKCSANQAIWVGETSIDCFLECLASLELLDSWNNIGRMEKLRGRSEYLSEDVSIIWNGLGEGYVSLIWSQAGVGLGINRRNIIVCHETSPVVFSYSNANQKNDVGRGGRLKHVFPFANMSVLFIAYITSWGEGPDVECIKTSKRHVWSTLLSNHIENLN